MRLSEREKWEAVVGCHRECDGVFYYAVATTGIFCRPSCKSRAPARENIRFYDRREDALAAGFRPCKRCRPDLPEYAPALELAGQAKGLIERRFAERERLADEMARLGVSGAHLAEVFRQQYGATPLEYRNRLRANAARRMLAETETPIAEVAEAAGFGSLSAFYAFFRREAGVSPGKYRRDNGRQKEEAQ